MASRNRDLAACGMRVCEPWDLDRAIAVASRADIPVPPTVEVQRQIGDAMVLLADNGFLFLAGRCAHHLGHGLMREELLAVSASLVL